MFWRGRYGGLERGWEEEERGGKKKEWGDEGKAKGKAKTGDRGVDLDREWFLVEFRSVYRDIFIF